MIFHHRAVSLAIIGSVAVLGGNSGAGSAVVSAAATDHHPQHNLANHNIVYQKSKKETTTATMTRARRAKKTKASVSDNLSMDSLPATTSSTYGAIDSRAADGIVATATGAGGDSSSSKSTKSAKNTQDASMTQDNALNYAGANGGIGDESTTIVVNPAALTAAPTTAKLPTAAPTDLPTLLIENKIYDEDVLVLPLGVNRDDNDGTETVISTVDEEEVELKAIDKWNFYMDHVPEDEPEQQQPRGQEGGQEDGGLKATDQFSFYTEHNKKDGGDIATRTGDDDDDDDGDVGGGRGGSNDEGTQAADEGASIVLMPIDDTQFYEDYVPDEGVGLDSDDEEGEVEEEEPEDEADAALRTIDMDPASVATTPTVSPTTPSPTMKPTNAPIVLPPPLHTNAPIVPPPPADDPTDSISSKTVAVPEDSCFEENGVEVCITYHADLSCEMKVDGMTCDCCRYNSAVGFISTFDCTNIGDQWGKMGLCEPGPMPVEEDKKKNRNKDDTIEEDALSILSLEYGDDETDIAADAISLAWSTAGTDSEATSTDSIASIAWLQRRGRRRAQAVRRKTAATKKRREAMTK